MKAPTTRPARRVYRGAPRPLAPGACPHCGRVVSIAPSGRRRRHFADGAPCTGGGVRVGDLPTVLLDDLPDVHLPTPAAERAQERRIRGPRASEPRERRPPKPGRAYCPECDREIPVNLDGSIRAHRARADVFAGPHCPGGGDATRSY